MSTAATQDILLAARGVEVTAGAKLPAVRIVAYSGGLMDVPGSTPAPTTPGAS